MENNSSSHITISDAAEILGLTVQQVRGLCRNGTLESQKFGNQWMVNKSGVAYHRENTCSGVAENQPGYWRISHKTNKPKVLSFFSGAMGMDIGLEQAGFELLLACETDKACRKTILRNHPDIALIGDIRDYTGDLIRTYAGLSPDEEIELVVGGPPCQAFSTAGKRQGFEDERGNVFLKFLDVIGELNPKYAVIENVRGLLSAPLKHRPHEMRGPGQAPLSDEEQPGGALRHIVNRLKSMGYGVSFNLYNAANFGTPQKRERVVMICARDGSEPPFLAPSHSQQGENGLKKWVSLRHALEGLETKEGDFISFPEKRLKYYRMLGPGCNWRSLPPDLQREALGKSYFAGGGKTGFLRRLAWDEPSPTLVTHPAMPATDLAHPVENRPLSVPEYRRIQQFPDDWVIEGRLLDKYRQIGNAVPVGLGRAIGEHIMKLLNGQQIKTVADFRYSRYRNTSHEVLKDGV